MINRLKDFLIEAEVLAKTTFIMQKIRELSEKKGRALRFDDINDFLLETRKAIDATEPIKNRGVDLSKFISSVKGIYGIDVNENMSLEDIASQVKKH